MKEIVYSIKEKLNVDVESIKFYAEGIINTNYLINEKYIYRRKKEFNQFNYHQDNEVDIENQLKDKNITIPFLYIDENIKITEFIPDAKDLSHFDKIDNDSIIAIANKLRELHSYHLKAQQDYMPFNRIEEYLYNARTGKLPIHDEIVNNMKKYYKNQTLYLCHNDLVPGNILFAHEKFYLIDFEYASNNSPFFDIASFITSNNIEDEKQQELFINTYYQSCQPENIEEMKKDFFSFHDLLWFYWSMMMYRNLNNTLYLDMAKSRLKGLSKHTNIDLNSYISSINN